MPDPETIVLPLYAETALIEKRTVETGRVRVHVSTTERPSVIEETLHHERVEVTRVPVGRLVDAVPVIREEAGVTIVPVVEEILVVERRLMLKEEVHIRRVQVNEPYRETIILREQSVSIDRSDSQ